jgi:predicted RND superfamily exporter protein
MKRFWDRLLESSWVVVAFFLVVTVFMVLGAGRIERDTSTEGSSPKHNAIVILNEKINKDFNSGRGEIIVLRASSVFTPAHLNEIRAITERLKAIDGVKKVKSLTNAGMMIEADGVLTTGDMVPRDDPSEAEIAAIRRYIDADYILKSGLLAAKDGSSTNIVIELFDGADMPGMAAPMEEAVSSVWTGTYDMAGVPTFQAISLSMMKRDMPLLSGIAFFIILLMFSLNYRSVFGIVMPLLQVGLGLIWGTGVFGWLGLKFQSLTIIAPISILAVGSSFTLHLLGRYFLELSQGAEKRAAIRSVLNHTGLGVFVSGLAISASMLTFLLSDIAVVRDFGILCALGVGACMISSLTLLPALMNLLPAPKVRVKLEGSGFLVSGLKALGRWIGRHPKAVFGAGTALVLVAALGIFRIVPNTSVVTFFKPDSTVIKGFEAIDKAFGGSTSVKMVVNGDLQDPELLKALLEFQEDIRSIPGVGPSTSIASLMRSLHETLTGEAGLPKTRELVAQELLVYQSSGSVDDITALTNLNYTQGVATIITPQLSTHDTKVLFSRLKERASAIIGTKAKAEFAGDILNTVAVEDVFIRDFIVSLSLSLLLVILIDSLIRSVRAALVTIIVIASTIVLQYGIIGIFGLPFSLASTLLGALAIGVGDYAIHLTVRYMEDRRRGLSPEDAVVQTLATSGRSIVFTALTLAGGFLALVFSDYMPVAALGGLMVQTVGIVGIATLVLLPAACLLFLRNPISHLEVKENA